MVFNTGAALLDAIVLAVVSRMCAGYWKFQNPPCIRFCGVFRKMSAWKPMTGNLQAGTEGIIKSQKKVWYS